MRTCSRFQCLHRSRAVLYTGWWRVAAQVLWGILIPCMVWGDPILEDEANTSWQPGADQERRVYTITRIDGVGPAIDGVLDEACWQLGEWQGGFRQRAPREGGDPVEATEIKLLYDDSAIYVAIRAFVADVTHRDKQIGRRDSYAGDMVGVAFDSYFDRRTAFQFDVSGGGSKMDRLLHPGGSDFSWNAVWDVAVGEESDAWVAEYRIPFSQLRFAPGVRDRVWGFHAWRWHRSADMESNWQLIPRDHSGYVFEFGELRGLEQLEPRRQFEILPFVSGSIVDKPKEDGNPFRSGIGNQFDVGLDAKIGLTSNFIVDLTILPDFGQVEADPSQLNLSTVETFFREQRPFFLEGQNLFDFEVKGDLLFYSRRIGRKPQHAPDTHGFVEIPGGTRILGAAKLSGKTGQGLSVGTLLAMAAEEKARLYEDGELFEVTAEPRTHYLVTRFQQELVEGGTVLGGIVTGTLRDLEANDPTLLAKRALTAGVDFSHRWWDRTHYLRAAVMGSDLRGSPAAIEELQRNYMHNFQRPDATHVEVDPTREELSGWGGNVKAGKDNGGHWRYGLELDWRSPGFNSNDVGFIDFVDRIRQDAVIRFVEDEPGNWFKRYQIRLNQSSQFVFDGTYVKHDVDLHGDFVTNGNWRFTQRIGYDSEVLDTRGLRGGPSIRMPGSVSGRFAVTSDGSKDLILWTSTYLTRSLEGGSTYLGLWPGFQIKRGSRFRFSFNLGYSEADYQNQWVGDTHRPDAQETAYLLGRMRRDTFESTVRLDYNFSPEITLSYYGNLYLTSGGFGEFKLVTDPLADRLESRYFRFQDDEVVRMPTDQLQLSYAGFPLRLADPDFNYRSFRSNLVLRWEYKPGSTLYVVWSHDREDSEIEQDTHMMRGVSRLVDSPANNTLLIKASYWFSI